MLKLARWSTSHRWYMLLGWAALLIVVGFLASSAGTSYSNNFTIPNSDAQRAADLLQRSFPAQAGDRDTIVFKVASGTVLDPAVRARMEAVFAKVAKLPHVAGVISPYASASGGKAISADGRIAFATVVFDEKANLLPKSAPERVVQTARAAARPGLEVELGGQAIELTEQEGFGIATGVGLLAAIVVLLLTFGSLTAMGLPIVTALFGLGTGLSAIALFTHVVDTPNFSSELAAMIGLGVGIDYALFILTRFREAYRTPGPTHENVRESVVRGDGHSRPGRPVRRHDGRDRAAGHDAARRRIPLRGRDLGIDRRAGDDARVAHAPACPADLRGRARHATLPPRPAPRGACRAGWRERRTPPPKAVDVAALERGGPAAAVGGHDRRGGDHADRRRPGDSASAGLQRRVQRPREPDDPPCL